MHATRSNTPPHETLLVEMRPGQALCLADGALLHSSGGPLALSPLLTPFAGKPSPFARLVGLAAATIQSPVPFWRVEAGGAVTLRLAAPWPSTLHCFRAGEEEALHLSSAALLAFGEESRIEPVSLRPPGLLARRSSAPRLYAVLQTDELWAMSFGAWETFELDGELQVDAQLLLGYAGRLRAGLLPAEPRAGLPGKASQPWTLALEGRGRLFMSTRQADDWAGQLLSTPHSQALDVRPE